jgi:hypothetical protein
MATPTNQVKKETTTHPQTRDAGPAYCRLLPYSGVIPVKSVIVEKEMASVLNNVCRQASKKKKDNQDRAFLKADRNQTFPNRCSLDKESKQKTRTHFHGAISIDP